MPDEPGHDLCWEPVGSPSTQQCPGRSGLAVLGQPASLEGELPVEGLLHFTLAGPLCDPASDKGDLDVDVDVDLVLGLLPAGARRIVPKCGWAYP